MEVLDRIGMDTKKDHHKCLFEKYGVHLFQKVEGKFLESFLQHFINSKNDRTIHHKIIKFFNPKNNQNHFRFRYVTILFFSKLNIIFYNKSKCSENTNFK